MDQNLISSEDECPGEFPNTEGMDRVKGWRREKMEEILNKKTQKKRRMASKNIQKEQNSVEERVEESDPERLDLKQIDMAQHQWLSDAIPQEDRPSPQKVRSQTVQIMSLDKTADVSKALSKSASEFFKNKQHVKKRMVSNDYVSRLHKKRKTAGISKKVVF